MIRSNSDTTTASTSSPIPVSPFASDSIQSETSEETPDLGAFTAVLRAWNSLQPNLRLPTGNFAQQAQTVTSSRTTTSSSDLLEQKSTVWSHRPIANYLSLSETVTTTDTDSTDRDRPRSVQIQDGEDDEADSFHDNDLYDSDVRDESDEQVCIQELSLEDVEEQPSLGYLDEALKFIAAERDRWTAQREAGTNPAMLVGIEPRRKRRRKRNKTPRSHSITRTPTASSFSASASISTITASSTIGDDVDYADDVADAFGADADDSSSSVDQQPSPRDLPRAGVLFRSTPGTPARRGRGRGRQTTLHHSRSTPQLRTFNHDEDDEEEDESSDPVTEESPRVQQLKRLGKKLETLFPEDKPYLKKVRYETMSAPAATGYHHQLGPLGYFDSVESENASRNVVLGGFVDTRGDPPKKAGTNDEKLIYVFVDHSNILIGLLNYLRRYPRQHPQYRDFPYNSPQSSANSASSPSVSGISPHPFTSPYPKPPKHLSHSALTLILERGRPVTRRILVTSSPLYQPMESAELLGFEVRVFARVPDTGDGMDRERNGKQSHKRSQSSGSSFNSYAGNGSNGAIGSSPTADSQNPKRQRKRAGSMNNNYSSINNINSNFNYNTNNNSSNSPFARRKAHSRKISDNTSTESEQNGGTSIAGVSQVLARSFGPGLAPAPGQHTYSHSLPTSHSSTPAGFPTPNSATSLLAPAAIITPQPPSRVRYREQGVDELLQLKLHQVLASVDGSPPKGSTIVLVTGDGNVGQFNEDGFLGVVRTALKKGWNVELYAWEGGLSRAWKREFGEGSEWRTLEGKQNPPRKGKSTPLRGGQSKVGSAKDDDDAPRFKVVGLEQWGREMVEIYY